MIRKFEKQLIALAILFLFFALFADDAILKWTGGIRFFRPGSHADGFMLFMTDFGLLYFMILLITHLFLKRKWKDLALMLLTGATSLEASYLLKVLFQTPRPFAAAIVATIPLTQASGFSMPSLHTAFCFSVWPYLGRIFTKKKQLYFGYSIIILIAFSRLYLGVHYLSDLVAGGLIGYIIARGWIYLEEKYKVLEWFIFHVKDKLELRRQIAHLFIGCTIVFLLRLQLLNEQLLFAILLIGGILSLVSRKIRIPILGRILHYFERPQDLKYFPGKGSFFLVLGSLLALKFFQRDVAYAAISIMAVGDAITTIIGTYFGKIKNPLNPKKHLEGTALAIVASTLAAFFFVDFTRAFYGSLAGMIFESLQIPYLSQILDDNVVIPLVAGAVIAMMG